MESEQKKLDVNMEDLQPIAAKQSAPLLDFSALHMQKIKIEKLEVIESEIGFDEKGVMKKLDVPREQLVVISENIASRVGMKEPDAEWRVREWFNLVKQKDGSRGWSLHEKGKLNIFLNAMRVSKPSELVGKEVMVKVVEKTNKEGQKESQLRFLY